MKIPVQLETTKTRTRWQGLQRIYQLAAKAINGNIEFGDPQSGPVNINGQWVTVTTPVAPNTDFTITHNLNRVAVGYMPMTKSAACDINVSPTANPSPKTQSILRASVGGVTLTLFVV